MGISLPARQLQKVIAAGLCALAVIGVVSQASAKDAPRIQITAPEGFESLEQEQELLVDLYFGGRHIGETMAAIAPDRISFMDVGQVLDLLPKITDRAEVSAFLKSSSLPANAHLACSLHAARSECGRLSPEMIGVIVDRDHFRVDIFLNPRLLEIRDDLENHYIPNPNKSLSIVNSIGGVLSGSSRGDDTVNLQNRTILAAGNKRLRADLTYSDEFGIGADRLALEWDVPEKRFSAGAIWAPGNSFTGRRKLLGVGIETQIDTREDKENILGSPVVVFLERRARVDLLRDGRVLSSRVYEAGNQLLDTSNLPDGSYQIVLRIEEAGGVAREETRFFTKSRSLPASGRTSFYALSGVLANDLDPSTLRFSSEPFAQAGLAFRLAEDFVVEGGTQLSGESATVEAGLTWLSPIAQIRVAAIAQDDGGYGSSLQFSSAGTSRFNYNIDIRRMRGSISDELDDSFGTDANEFDLDRVGQITNYTQLGGIMSYSTSAIRLFGTLFYRDEPGQSARYSIGPSVEWDLYRRGQIQVTFRSDFTASDSGNSGFAGISFRLVGKKSSVSAKVGGRRSSNSEDSTGSGAVAALAGTWNGKVAGGEVAIGTGIEHQPREDSAILSSEFRHPTGSVSADLVHTQRGANDSTQYAFGFQSTLVAGRGELDIAGRTTTESLIIAQVAGARNGDVFEVIVNEHVMGVVEGSESLKLALPAYRSYNIRMRPIGADLLSYDGSTREIGLYPGAVEKLEWVVAPIAIKFGRLIDSEGYAIPNASITGKGVWSETDALGYFQIEVADDEPLTVTLANGKTFAITLPAADDGSSFAQLGDVACCETPQSQVAALGAIANRSSGDKQ